jgi:uncharacterized protein (DUF2252 family)
MTSNSLTPDRLRDASRDELYRLAREKGVPGRSRKSKEELVAALLSRAESAVAVEHSADDDGGPRVDAFAGLARARARGEMVLLPRMLRGNDRRLHVRQTIREDHEHRIARGSTEAEEKFEKLADSVFDFFRGTALLFYRDLAGEDAGVPTVLTLGDVHPENFGVMPSADNVPIFGVNDFDEAYYAPFTWDLKRGVVGFVLAVAEEGGYGAKRQRKAARHFVRGYIEGMKSYVHSDHETSEQMRLDNAPGLVAELIEDALTDRSSWLADKYLDEHGRGFRADDELVPISSRRAEFQEALDGYVRRRDGSLPERAGEMRLKDVCERRGQGTASLGLARYYLLVEGPRGDATDDLVLEMKQARRSALAGLVPPSEVAVDGRADRVAHAQEVQLVRGDVFYGSIDFDELSFLLRERAPYRDSVDLDDLSKSAWTSYARICGRALAQAHALSDDSGRVAGDLERRVLGAIGAENLFVDDMLRFAQEAAERVRADHAHFRADHALGAFRTVDVDYH